MRIPVALALAASLLAVSAPPTVDAAEVRTRSFKLVKPPKLGVRRRLTITTTRSVTPPGAIRRVARHGWFWRQASADLKAADPARLVPLAATAGGRLGGLSRRALVEEVSETWRAEIAAAAQGAQISEALLIAVIAAESGGDPRAVSPAGALGLGQLMPATARRFAVSDPFAPGDNLRGAADYLSTLLTMFDGDGLLALAGYNAGENAVLRHKGVPPYPETRDYVPIVLSYYNEARTLCLMAPTDPRAPCVVAALPPVE
ncbi:lytic transglycosylase domain-containing protein [Pikeienuella piscinae]|uniref:Lytic transglycosylase domain-containing protein n=1 Tax=Pikeienuella piscinae TaxID=2748098 RepID=A0A7M3T5E8_9RHOB|nr:lytic transglycosylase domain-containing protein [Pikeienuella piscinae]QIE57229.1 lytic transglycosylase domain-containing protein [Pikeienuella piscinae]